MRALRGDDASRRAAEATHRAAAREDAHRAAGATRRPDDNQFTGTVHDFLYMGDVTVYRIATAGGARVEALLANSGSGRAKFFEVGDAVSFGWRADAGHFLEA